MKSLTKTLLALLLTLTVNQTVFALPPISTAVISGSDIVEVYFNNYNSRISVKESSTSEHLYILNDIVSSGDATERCLALARGVLTGMPVGSIKFYIEFTGYITAGASSDGSSFTNYPKVVIRNCSASR